MVQVSVSIELLIIDVMFLVRAETEVSVSAYNQVIRGSNGREQSVYCNMFASFV